VLRAQGRTAVVQYRRSDGGGGSGDSTAVEVNHMSQSVLLHLPATAESHVLYGIKQVVQHL